MQFDVGDRDVSNFRSVNGDGHYERQCMGLQVTSFVAESHLVARSKLCTCFSYEASSSKVLEHLIRLKACMYMVVIVRQL